jgi:glycerate 2-kinase
VLRPEIPTPTAAPSARALLIRLYRQALEAVDGRTVMARAASGSAPRDTAVIALGKAAGPMLAGACDVLGAHCVSAFVVTTAAAPVESCAAAIHWHVGDHPIPGERSLAAGEALAAYLAALPAERPVWVLVSGGASSLVEQLLPGVTLSQLQQLTQWALAHDVPIRDVNALRRRLSALKDGRLAARLAGRPAQAFVLSDVPGDDPSVVGSGLVAARTPSAGGLAPDWPAALLAGLGTSPPPLGATLPVQIVGTLADALAAVERAARAAGLTVERVAERIDGPVAAAGTAWAERLAGTRADLLVAGGETTVALPPAPGTGGRCQHLALAAAVAMQGSADRWVLAAGTDGIDGASEDAGAVVDGGTVQRAALEGFDARACLTAANAGPCLEASGDLLHTGPTATNVGDLVLGLRTDRAALRGSVPCVS